MIKKAITLIIAIGAAVIAAPLAHAQSVVPRDGIARGSTTAQWAARWWQWALSVPEASNPAADATGEDCAVGQAGPVWFLAGTFAGATTVTRACTVPRNRYLFFPILSGVFGSAVFDCEPSVPGVLCNLTTLRKAAGGALNNVTLAASIDGVAIPALSGYRVATDDFLLTFPEGAVFGIPEGTYSPQVADGYWLMLRPLSAGDHTVTFSGEFLGGPFGGTGIDVTYNLTVRP